MASIIFELDGTAEGRRDLAAFLHEEKIALPSGVDARGLAIKFEDVPESLAVWLISSMSPLHGLNKIVLVEEKDEPVPSEASSSSKSKSDKPSPSPKPSSK